MFQTLDVYIVSLVILGIIVYKTLNNPGNDQPQSRAFSLLIIFNILIIIADSVSVLLDGVRGPGVRTATIAATVFGYILQILICLYWFRYSRIVVLPDSKANSVMTLAQVIPGAVCIVATILSCWTGWVFSVDSANVYHRGDLFGLIVGVSYFYILCGYYMVIRFRKKLEPRYRAALLCFALPPSIGGVLQTVFYGTSFIWSGTTISLLIIYIAIQNELLLLDHLTGINNRRSFDLALARRIANARSEGAFALILVDLDNFRSINDRYGHVEGDRALQSIASILGEFFSKDAFVARYGGDEFAVILELSYLSELIGIQDRLQRLLDEWNGQSMTDWRLSVSMGYAPYLPIERMNPDQYLLQVDKMLCLDKIAPGNRRLKNSRRR